MQAAKLLTTVLISLLCAAAAGCGGSSPNIAGSWSGTATSKVNTNTANNTITFTLLIAQSGGTLSGSESTNGSTTLPVFPTSGGTITTGSTISGNSVTINLSGTVMCGTDQVANDTPTLSGMASDNGSQITGTYTNPANICENHTADNGTFTITKLSD